MPWFYQLMGEQFGPMSTDQLRAKIIAGEVLRDTLIRSDTREDWALADTIPGLFDGTLERRMPETTTQTSKSANRQERSASSLGTTPPPLSPPSPKNTSLCDCPDCGAPISKRAISCPQCGSPSSISPVTSDVPNRKTKSIPMALALCLAGSIMVFYAYSENSKLNRIDSANEDMARSINNVNRAFADFEGGLQGAIRGAAPEKVAEKSDRTLVATCFALGGVFIALGLTSFAIRR